MQVFINRDLISSLNGGDNQLSSGGSANRRLMTQLGTRRLAVLQGDGATCPLGGGSVRFVIVLWKYFEEQPDTSAVSPGCMLSGPLICH